jgi:hypothetical protein
LAKAEALNKPNLATGFAASIADEYERPNIYDHKPLDEAEARKWYAYAAAKGNSYQNTGAAYHLGLMYWEGRGGSQDKQRAKYLWMWAAENKDGMAVVKLEELGFDMQKERELAFSKARAHQSQPAQIRGSNESAGEGLVILFGLLALRVLSRDECYDYRRAQLAGSPWLGPVPEKCR